MQTSQGWIILKEEDEEDERTYLEKLEDILDVSSIPEISTTNIMHCERLRLKREVDPEWQMTKMEMYNLIFLGHLSQNALNKDLLKKYGITTKLEKKEKEKKVSSLYKLCYLMWITQGTSAELLRADTHLQIADCLNLDSRDPKLLNILHNLEDVIQFDITDVNIEDKIAMKSKQLARILDDLKEE